MQQELGDRVTFLGIAGLAERDDMVDFVDRHGLDGFAHAVDADGDIWTGFGISVQSSFVFLDDDGTRAEIGYGAIGEDELRERVRQLLSS